MKFIPSIGDHFYCKVKAYVVEQQLSDSALAATVTQKVTDNSYQNNVLKCLGRDDTAIVAQIVHGSSWAKPELMKIERYEFEPVGPEVLKVLGLIELSDSVEAAAKEGGEQ